MAARSHPLTRGRPCAGCGARNEDSPLVSWCAHCQDRWGVVPGWWEAEPGGAVGWSAARYAGPPRRAVLLAKRGVGAGLAELLIARLPAGCLPRGAVVTWIPAHPRRALLRPDCGASLARAVAAKEGLRCAALLRRSARGRRQAGRDPDDRRAEPERLGLRVRGAVPPAVVLVDDVRTTGATLDYAAELLRNTGARHVMGVTATIAPPPGLR